MRNPYRKDEFQGNLPLIGFDFKLLYGNLNKMDDSSIHAEFIFNDPNDRREIEDNISLVELNQGKCYHLTNDVCSIESSYEIQAGTDVDTTEYEYLWELISGSAEIITEPDQVRITVKSTDIETTQNFTLRCSVVNDNYEQKIFQQEFTHEVVTIGRITISALDELSNTSCEFETNRICEASSSYKVTAINVDTYEWIVTGEATITDGQGTDTITVKSNTDHDVSFTVECICSNLLDTASISGSYIHDRTEIVVAPIIINDIIEKVAGTCEYEYQGSCVATGTYDADILYASSYLWEIVSGSATIVSGQGTTEVVVETSGNSNQQFDLKITGSNTQYPSQSLTETFIHTHQEQYYPDVVITSLTETSSGSCGYDSGDTCVAQSTYNIVQTGGEVYNWEITGATLISGQNTDTIVVETTGDTDIVFNVKCTVSNDKNSSSINNDFTHTRTANEVLSQSVTYDSSNIAQEFIA